MPRGIILTNEEHEAAYRHQINLRISRETRDELRAIARATGETEYSALIRRLIHDEAERVQRVDSEKPSHLGGTVTTGIPG